MKHRKSLKLVLIILICMLIILIGFGGIYIKQFNQYINKIPNYKLASDLKGATILELEVDDSVNTTYYDKDGNEISESDIENTKDYTTEEEPVNSKENLTTENYEKSLKVFKERLNFLQADQYSIDLDKKTGKIVLNFEDEYPEDIESILPMEGKLQLKDSNTSDIILDASDTSIVKNVETTYATTEDGSYVIYMSLKLTDLGIEKVNNMEAYKNSTDEDGENTVNKFVVAFDEEQIEEVSSDDILLTAKTLRITLAKDLTSTTTVNSTLNTATIVSKLSNIGKTPVVYTISAEEYINTTENDIVFYTLLLITAIIMVVICIYFIIKYKVNGLLATIGTITNIALITILIRLTNIALSFNSIAAIVGLIILNTCLINNLLKEIKNNTDKTIIENTKIAYLKTIDLISIILILFVVFAFSNMTVINTMGLLLFWGWIVLMLGNILFTVTLLTVKNNRQA